MSLKTWLTATLVVLSVLLGRSASAISSATVNIDIQVNDSLSVAVNSVASSTDATIIWSTPNQKAASASTATVTNDSGIQIETWALSVSSPSIDQLGGSGWAVKTTTITLPGINEFAVQAVFGSSNTAGGSCPGVNSNDWGQGFAVPLTASPVTYTSAVFADSSLANNGTPNPDNGQNQMFPASKRALCWKIILPSMTTTANTQNIQVTITAQSP